MTAHFDAAAFSAPLTLGLLSPHDPADRTAFSGTAWHAARALAAVPGLRLRILGRPDRRRPGRGGLVSRLTRRPRPVDPDRIDLAGLDAVLGLVATPFLDRLAARSALPFLHVTDATPAFLAEAYGRQVPATAERRERRVAERALCIYSSAAMARRAPSDLDLPDLAPLVLPFGVNLETLPARLPEKPSLDRLELLFVGLDWHRKGGDLALAALDRLAAGGRDVRLTVIGGVPPHAARHPRVRALGFLDKNRPRQARRLARAYASSHLLVLPTRGDCTPMVIAEAMAHGTPAVATDTGGVAELVGGPGSGRVLPPGAGARHWAAAIASAASDDAAYALLSDAAFERRRTLYSWDRWAAGIARTARALVSRGAATLAA